MSQASIWPYFISACKGSFPWQVHWFAIFHGWPLPDSPYFTPDRCRTIYFSRSRTVVMMRNWFPVGWLVDDHLLVSVTSIHDDHLSREYLPVNGPMLGQRRRRWPNIKTTLAEHPCYLGTWIHPTKHNALSNVWSMLVHRLRRWPTIPPTLSKRLVLAKIVSLNPGP